MEGGVPRTFLEHWVGCKINNVIYGKDSYTKTVSSSYVRSWAFSGLEVREPDRWYDLVTVKFESHKPSFV